MKQVKKTELYDLNSIEFCKYGRKLSSKDYIDLLNRLIDLPIPEEIIYRCSDLELEKTSSRDVIEETMGMIPLQIGYCAGQNKKLEALEYHKSSEIIVAGTDIILFLGSTFDIVNDKYKTDLVEGFKMMKGEVVEIYSTTLHYCPIAIQKYFSAAVILPKYTNESLDKEVPKLFAKNKWLYGHKNEFDIKSSSLAGELVGELIDLENLI